MPNTLLFNATETFSAYIMWEHCKEDDSRSRVGKLSVGVQYTFELPVGWSGTVRGDDYQQGPSYARIYNTAADRIDSWQKVNASLQISNSSNGIQLEAYVKTLLDDDLITDVYLADDTSGLLRNGFLLEPRTFGFSIQKSF